MADRIIKLKPNASTIAATRAAEVEMTSDLLERRLRLREELFGIGAMKKVIDEMRTERDDTHAKVVEHIDLFKDLMRFQKEIIE